MIKACVFDAFGTLFNLQIPLNAIKEKTGGKAEALLDIWRRKQLEYSWLRSLMQNYAPFSQVTREALQFAMDSTGIKEKSLFDILMPIYENPACFPEVKPMLNALKEKGITTAILSNGTLKMLRAGVSNTGLEALVDRILSVDTIGVYKPDPRVYKMALNQLDLDKSEFYFLSSNQWDIAGATQFGLQTIWVNQFGQVPDRLPPKAKLVIKSLAELPDKIGG